jgi:hypothetical protein
MASECKLRAAPLGARVYAVAAAIPQSRRSGQPHGPPPIPSDDGARHGMHKYNNQNHAMMTAMLAAPSVLAGAWRDEVWINEDTQYHEAGYAGMHRALEGGCLVLRK